MMQKTKPAQAYESAEIARVSRAPEPPSHAFRGAKPKKSRGLPGVTEHSRVDRTLPVPLYYQVFKQIEQAIVSGELLPGTQLPTLPELSSVFSVSLPTIRKAIDDLSRQGYLDQSRGSRARVATPVQDSPSSEDGVLIELLDPLQLEIELVLASRRTQPDNRISRRLELQDEDAVDFVQCLRTVAEMPVALIERYRPAGPVGATGRHAQRGRGGSGKHARVDEVFSARQASAAEASVLQVREADALFTRERVRYDGLGHPIDIEYALFRPDTYVFRTRCLS